jgi:peptidoglycan/LPS O-acetylase OafA/YrhL
MDIQGLRAIAVLMVVAFHAGVGLRGGFAGVEVFFVISGFVITGTLLRELSTGGGADLPRFYARRVKRLFPALAAMLIFVAVAGVLLIPVGSGHVTAVTGIFASLFTANFYLYALPTGYFATSVQLNPLLHTWTLAVEEQFYLVFPAVLLGAWWLGSQLSRPRAIATLLVGAVCGMSFILALGWADGSSTFGSVSSPRAFAFYASPARGWEFGVGCVAALLTPAFRRIPNLVGLALAALGLTAIGVTALTTTGGDSLWRTAVVPTLGCCALLLAGFAGGNALSRLLGLRPAVAVGDLSYSLYLWHWPLIVFAVALFPSSGWAAPIAAAVAFVPAWASYRYLENPVRRSTRVRGRVVVAMAVGCVVLPIAASAGLAAVQPHLPTPSQAAALHADVLRGCDSALPYGDPRRPVACTSTTPDARGTAVLIGDSNAGQFIEPFERASHRAGFDATTATLRDCPFAQLQVHFLLGQGNACAVFNRRSLENLLRARPALVVIAARTDWYLNAPGPGQASVAALANRRWTGDPSRKATLFTEGLHDEIKALNAARVPVVLIHPVPVLPINEQGCAAVLLMLNGCRKSLPRSAVERSLRAARRVENNALHGQRAAWSVDFEDELCSTHDCASRRSDGLVMYRDQDHLSVDGARTLAPEFFEIVRSRAATRSG